MAYFDFSRIINKYTASFTLVTETEGKYVAGRYQKGTEMRSELFGAIISRSMKKQYQSGGTYTEQDRILYILSPITQPLKGAKVIFNNQVYSVEEDRDIGNERFTGVYCYRLKWVSAFVKS